MVPNSIYIMSFRAQDSRYKDKMVVRQSLLYNNKANLRDLIAATGLIFLHYIGFKSLIFAHVTCKFDGRPRKQ